jgi:hypothetical protein
MDLWKLRGVRQVELNYWFILWDKYGNARMHGVDAERLYTSTPIQFYTYKKKGVFEVQTTSARYRLMRPAMITCCSVEEEEGATNKTRRRHRYPEALHVQLHPEFARKQRSRCEQFEEERCESFQCVPHKHVVKISKAAATITGGDQQEEWHEMDIPVPKALCYMCMCEHHRSFGTVVQAEGGGVPVKPHRFAPLTTSRPRILCISSSKKTVMFRQHGHSFQPLQSSPTRERKKYAGDRDKLERATEIQPLILTGRDLQPEIRPRENSIQSDSIPQVQDSTSAVTTEPFPG